MSPTFGPSHRPPSSRRCRAHSAHLRSVLDSRCGEPHDSDHLPIRVMANTNARLPCPASLLCCRGLRLAPGTETFLHMLAQCHSESATEHGRAGTDGQNGSLRQVLGQRQLRRDTLNATIVSACYWLSLDAAISPSGHSTKPIRWILQRSQAPTSPWGGGDQEWGTTHIPSSLPRKPLTMEPQTTPGLANGAVRGQ
jgi:hypothetical protein